MSLEVSKGQVMDEGAAAKLTEDIRRTAVNYAEARIKLQELVAEAKQGNAHVALGYASWTAYLADVLGEKPMRLARDERQEMVSLLSGEGMSSRAIAPIVGATDRTIRNDLSGGQNFPPEPAEPVQGMDGKSYARPVPEAERLREAVAEFPELEFYVSEGRTADVLRLAGSLRQYREPELSERRDNLRKTIAAEKRRLENPEPVPAEDPDYYELADSIFLAANTAARAIKQAGGAESVAAAVQSADRIMIAQWRDEFDSLAQQCQALASACAPKLRTVK